MSCGGRDPPNSPFSKGFFNEILERNDLHCNVCAVKSSALEMSSREKFIIEWVGFFGDIDMINRNKYLYELKFKTISINYAYSWIKMSTSSEEFALAY